MSYVYFARCGDYVKIGFSYRPEHRVRGLFNGAALICPDDLDVETPVELVHVIADCVAKDERRIHSLFDRWRAEGEWFRATPDFWDAVIGLRYLSLADERKELRRIRASLKSAPALSEAA